MAAVQAPIRIEAETLTRDGYRIEKYRGATDPDDIWITLRTDKDGAGKASGVFTGDDGFYNVSVGYFDENDGQSQVTIIINGIARQLEFDKDLPSGMPTDATRTTEITHRGIELSKGDTIEIRGKTDGGEYARINFLDFIPVEGDTPSANETPTNDDTAGDDGSAPSDVDADPAPNLGSGYGAFEAEVFRLTNEFRVQNGRDPLKIDARLNESAEAHSQNMADLNFFSHTGRDGSRAGDRMEDAGYDWRGWGENIAAGQKTPEQVVQAWINSSGHRANMLNSNWEEIGVGYVKDTDGSGYGHYWTQNFAVGDSAEYGLG